MSIISASFPLSEVKMRNIFICIIHIRISCLSEVKYDHRRSKIVISFYIIYIKHLVLESRHWKIIWHPIDNLSSELKCQNSPFKNGQSILNCTCKPNLTYNHSGSFRTSRRWGTSESKYFKSDGKSILNCRRNSNSDNLGTLSALEPLGGHIGG